MSIGDLLYRKNAYYWNTGVTPVDGSGDITNTNLLVPWKLNWDPTRGMAVSSEEIIEVRGAGEVPSGTDPESGERYWRYTQANNPLPLRHDLFRADNLATYLEISYLMTDAVNLSEWVLIPAADAAGVEGDAPTVVFFIRRDIPLTEDVGFSVGRTLFKGNIEPSSGWANIAYLRIRTLYLGDYVRPDSFNQDLHQNATVAHRHAFTDFVNSSQFERSHSTTSRYSKVYSDFSSAFLKGTNPAAGTPEVITSDLFSRSIQVTDGELRTGVNTITFPAINVEGEGYGRAHAGDWITDANYREIEVNKGTLATSLSNFILSFRQPRRLLLADPIVETNQEAVLQYDASEGAWQIGHGADITRRTYSGSQQPYLTRRYPIVARFAQGRTAATHTGFVDSGHGAPSQALEEANGRNALITTFPNDPTMLRVHTEVELRSETNNRYFWGLNSWRLYSPHILGDAGILANMRATQTTEGALTFHHVIGEYGFSGTRRARRITETFTVDPSDTGSVNVTSIRWLLQGAESTPTYALQLNPANSSGTYTTGNFTDLLRIGLRGYGTAGSSKNVFFGAIDPTELGSYIARARSYVTSFDLVFGSHMKPLVRGNMEVQGLFDTYSDVALGRDKVVTGAGTLDVPAALRSVYSTDTVEVNRSTSGFLNIHGSTLNSRRLSGPTVTRLDMQLRYMLGWDRPAIPAFAKDTYRTFEPFSYSADIDASRDLIDSGTEVTLGVPSVAGKVDSWGSRYVQYSHSSSNLTLTDHTAAIVRGKPFAAYTGAPITSGFVRGQLHASGHTARSRYGISLAVDTDTRGIPTLGGDGALTAHDGNPQLKLASADMYLDADGEWRYLFDRVYVPVEQA